MSADEAELRRRFNVAVAGIFTLVLAPLFSWLEYARLPKDAPALWRRALLALAVLDTVLLVAVGGLVLQVVEKRKAPPPPPPMRIGVQSAAAPDGGVLAETVFDGAPAHKAGLRSGDVIRSVDGVPLSAPPDLAAVIGKSKEGEQRRLHVERGGEALELDVLPVSDWKPPPRPEKGLFEADAQAKPWSIGARELAVPIGVLATLVLLAGLARRRGAELTPALAVIAVLAVEVAVVFGVLRLAGSSRGASWLALMAGQVVALAVAAPFLRRVAVTPINTAGTFRLGLLYLYGGLVRLGILFGFASGLAETKTPTEKVVEYLSPTSPGDLALLALAAAVLAPLMEEVVFRGLLLGWLARWTSGPVAIGVSAVLFGALHTYYGVGVVGPMYIGVVLGWMRLRSGSLKPGIALHMLVNSLFVLGQLGSLLRRG